jgi:hypothetical protein
VVYTTKAGINVVKKGKAGIPILIYHQFIVTLGKEAFVIGSCHLLDISAVKYLYQFSGVGLE